MGRLQRLEPSGTGGDDYVEIGAPDEVLVVVNRGASTTLLHWQSGIGSVQRLDEALLVDGAHYPVVRRTDEGPDDIDGLLGEGGILRELQRLPAMGWEAMCRPDPPHRRNGELDRRRYRARGAMSDFVRRRSRQPPAEEHNPPP